MRKYVIIYNNNKGDEFKQVLHTDDRETATAMADAFWCRLTRNDWKNCRDFFLGYSEFDEEGCVIFDTMEVVRKWK